MFKNETLDGRHWVVLFIAGVTLCAIFFALGLYVGKWSAGQTASTANGRAAYPLAQLETVPKGPAEGASTTESPDTANPPADQTAVVDRPPGEAAPGSSPPGATSIPEDLSAGARGTSAPEGAAPETPRSFSVRAGIFDQAQQAEELASLLRSRGFVSAYVEQVKTEDGLTRHQVLLGPWVDRESAARAMSELRNEGVSNVNIIGRP